MNSYMNSLQELIKNWSWQNLKLQNPACLWKIVIGHSLKRLLGSGLINKAYKIGHNYRSA